MVSKAALRSRRMRMEISPASAVQRRTDILILFDIFETFMDELR